MLTCFIDDRFGVANRRFLNMDNVMWECDYPHSDSTWPFSPEQVAEHFDDSVSDHDIDRITHLNAMRHFRSTPSPRSGAARTARWGLRDAPRGTTCRSGRCGPTPSGSTPPGRSTWRCPETSRVHPSGG